MSEESQRPRRRRRQPQAPPEPQGSPVKGAILVVVAVVIGLVLLRDDGASTAQVAVGADDNPAESEDPDTSSSSTTPTTAAVRATSEVKVLVANGSGVNGAAGSTTTELEALGYVTANPTDAERVTATVIYFTDSYEPEALALAAAIGAPETAVVMIPTPAPVADTQLSNIIVVVGPDLATSG